MGEQFCYAVHKIQSHCKLRVLCIKKEKEEEEKRKYELI